MRRVVLCDTACNFNAFISNQSIFNCLITRESTLILKELLWMVHKNDCTHIVNQLWQLTILF